MSNTVKAGIEVDFTGNVPQVSARFQKSVARFANDGTRRLSTMQRATQSLGRQVDVLGNRYTAFASTVAAGAAIKFAKDFNAKITRLGTNANISGDKLTQLKQAIQDVSVQEDIRINSTDLLNAVDVLIGKTGDVDHAIANVRNLGLTVQGFGADAQSAAGLVAQYWEKGIRAPDDVLATNDRIFTQFAKGSLSAADIARVAPELFSTIQKMGPRAIAEMGALAQMFTKSTGNAQKAVTAVKAVFRAFTDESKLKVLTASGLNIFADAEGKILRPANEILREIVETANSNPRILSKVFESEALQGMKSLLTEKNLDLLDELTVGTVELGKTQQASAKNAEELNAALLAIGNVLKNVAVDKLTDPLIALADVLAKLDPKTIEKLVDFSMMALGGIALRKGYKSFSGGKSGEVAGSGNGLLDAAGGLAPVPVFVVNQLPGMAGKFGKGLSKGKKLSNFGMLKNQTLKTTGAMGGKALALGAGYVGAAGLGGYAIGSLINHAIEGTKIQDAIGKALVNSAAFVGFDSAKESVAKMAKLEIELTGDGAKNATVKSIDAANLDLEVGGSMTAP